MLFITGASSADGREKLYLTLCNILQERRQQTVEEMGAMEDEMRQAEELIKTRKDHADKQQVGSKR